MNNHPQQVLKILDMEDLAENWDSYHALPIDLRCIHDAIHYLIMPPADANLPEHVWALPCTDGGVMIEWHMDGRDGFIAWHPDGEIEQWEDQ